MHYFKAVHSINHGRTAHPGQVMKFETIDEDVERLLRIGAIVSITEAKAEMILNSQRRKLANLAGAKA